MLQDFIEGFYYTICLCMIQTTLMMLDHELLGESCDGGAKNIVTLWTKLAILSKNRGNLIYFFSILPDNVTIAMLTSLLSCCHLSCHVFHIVISLAT
jgi:hypothetical protein